MIGIKINLTSPAVLQGDIPPMFALFLNNQSGYLFLGDLGFIVLV